LRGTKWTSKDPEVTGELSIGENLHWQLAFTDPEGKIHLENGEHVATGQGFDEVGTFVIFYKDGGPYVAFGSRDEQLLPTTELIYDNIQLVLEK
jgi:hypothetical protein